jgi:signal transduction histidine kinase
MIRASTSPPKWVAVLLWIGVWTLLGLTFAALSYASSVGEARRPDMVYALKQNLTRFYVWAALAPFIFRFTYRFPVEFRPLRLPPLLLHLPALFLFSSIHQLIYFGVAWQLEPTFKRHFSSLTEFYLAAFWGVLYSNILIASLIVITAHAFLYYRSYRAGEVQRSQLKAELAQAQLQALKMQLHPHFLFNTLHSISSLVLEDPPKANSMIARLGDFLRLTLEHSAHQMVMLKQEIEFLRCYLEIEQVRFQDRLAVDFRIEPAALQAEVPQLILQPIVENAIRYAIAPRAAQGYIKVEAERADGLLRLAVKDNGPGIDKNGDAENRQGVGLNNVRARLEQIYGHECRFEITNAPEGGLTVTIEMPFRSEMDERVIALRESI